MRKTGDVLRKRKKKEKIVNRKSDDESVLKDWRSNLSHVCMDEEEEEEEKQ